MPLIASGVYLRMYGGETFRSRNVRHVPSISGRKWRSTISR